MKNYWFCWQIDITVSVPDDITDKGITAIVSLFDTIQYTKIYLLHNLKTFVHKNKYIRRESTQYPLI